MSELEQIKKAESRESKVTVLAIDDEADFLEFVGEAISSENVDFLSTTRPGRSTSHGPEASSPGHPVGFEYA